MIIMITMMIMVMMIIVMVTMACSSQVGLLSKVKVRMVVRMKMQAMHLVMLPLVRVQVVVCVGFCRACTLLVCRCGGWPGRSVLHKSTPPWVCFVAWAWWPLPFAVVTVV